MRRATMPDPMNSHGAWVALFVSIAAGSLSGAGGRVERGLVVGTLFAGGFLVVSAVAMGLRRKSRQLLLGLSLGSGCVVLAHALRVDPRCLWPLGAAALAAVGAMAALRRFGVLSRPALCLGLASLSLAAPAAALACGSSAPAALSLFVALWPFLCWRSLLVASTLRGVPRWDRVQLRARGLREAAYAATWGLCVSLAMA